MADYEKLGVFYLGKEYDLAEKKLKDDLLLYDSKDLVTHAVVVGMTGSGKTGLCIGMIEEAAIDGVPSIIIDPKGDLTNLLLTFPGLQPSDFLPWINLDDARQKGLSPEDFAAKQADQWKNGLASWGQGGDRIQRLRDAAEFRIYTPASSAGIPVSILKSFAAPPPALMEDNEMMRERISTTVTSLLSLIGIEADPVQSREFILLSTILDSMWRQGQDLDLARLITQVQNPPVTRIGVLDLESFYPSKDRFGLVMALNNLLASPGFNAWLEGEALDIGQILYSPQGKPRVAIFSIAHLADAERMFFVSLLLNQVLGWMRSQSGTSSLRAILYMDEIFGYLPPLGNPPSKLPMLTLLKQARAFGLGLVLATQNPVDLDYKALSNAGTWFIGRLQTERDKARVLDGLEGAAAGAGGHIDRQDMDRILSGLGSRVFLLNNIHEDQPVIMTTRWALSYLRGPLTREQIRSLMAPFKSGTAPAPAAASQAAGPAPAAGAAPAAAARATAPQAGGQPPALPPEVQQYYIPVRGRGQVGTKLVYQPRVLGAAKINFADTKTRINTQRGGIYLVPVSEGVVPVDWAEAQEIQVALSDLDKRPAADAIFAELPPAAMQPKSYTAWNKEFAGWLYGSQSLELLSSPALKMVSNPGEDEREFRIRLSQAAREARDEAVDALRKKYATKINGLAERKRKAEQAVDREKEQARQSQMQTAISFGASLLGAFTGRKLTARSNIGRVTTAARGIGRSMDERGDVKRAEDTVEVLEKQQAELQSEFDAEVAALTERLDAQNEELTRIAVRPKKADISVQLLALAWAPYWQDESGALEAAF